MGLFPYVFWWELLTSVSHYFRLTHHALTLLFRNRPDIPGHPSTYFPPFSRRAYTTSYLGCYRTRTAIRQRWKLEKARTGIFDLPLLEFLLWITLYRLILHVHFAQLLLYVSRYISCHVIWYLQPLKGERLVITTKLYICVTIL